MVQGHFACKHWSFPVHKLQAFTPATNMRSHVGYEICLRVQIYLGYDPVPFSLAKVQTEDRTQVLMNSCHPTDLVMSGKWSLMLHLSAQLRAPLKTNELHGDLILRNFCAAPESEFNSHELFCVDAAVRLLLPRRHISR